MEGNPHGMTVGFPRMHKEVGERRDFLPDLVAAVAQAGAEVVVEEAIGSWMGLADVDYTTIVVNGPNRFDIRFNTATGGSINRFVDAEEDIGVDLAGGIANGEGMPNAVVVQGGLWHAVAQNENGARLHLLEATPARVRVRGGLLRR